MRALLAELGEPQRRYPSIHVVGSNGKSTAVRTIEALLESEGLRVGAYLSPHVRGWSERIRVGGYDADFERVVAHVRPAAEKVGATQFEALTAAAFAEFASGRVDVAVVEAGLGGRYDATSVVDPAVVVLTNVGLEHTRWLGPTERHVAEEKLAVVKRGTKLVTGPLEGAALAVAERTAREQRSPMRRLGHDLLLETGPKRTFSVKTARARYPGLRLGALGRFQRLNFAVALCAAEEYLGELDPDSVREAAASLRLPGRLEVRERDPLVIFDGAHNPPAAIALRESLGEVVGERRLVAVISVLDDKDAAGMLSILLPRCAHVVFTRSSHARALPAATLESLCRQLDGPAAEVAGDPSTALERARALVGNDGAVLVTGSIYLLSDLVRAQSNASAAGAV
jgi:dihydrofolate synthase/folylpolyglutamate synthase